MLSDTIVLRLRDARHQGRGASSFAPVASSCRTDPVERRATRVVPAPVPLPPALAREMEGVGDDELRAIIENAASRNLAHFREPFGCRLASEPQRIAARRSRPSRR